MDTSTDLELGHDIDQDDDTIVAVEPSVASTTRDDFEIVTLEQQRLASELAANRAIDLGLELTTVDLTAFAHRHLGEPDATATG